MTSTHSAVGSTDEPKPLKKLGSFGTLLGLRVIDWSLDRCTVVMDVENHHLNGNGVVHGGVVTSLLDTALAHCGIYCTVPGNHRTGPTVSITVNFLRPVRSGRITATARKRGGGKTLFMASAEAVDENGALIATAESVHRYGPGSGKPEGVPRSPDG